MGFEERAIVVWAWLPFLAASGCGSSHTASSAVAASEAGAGDGGVDVESSSNGSLGSVCSPSQSKDCASGVCVAFTDSAQKVTGMCSLPCSSPTGCGSDGACIQSAALDAGFCYRTCAAASACPQEIPCIWYASLDGGLCQPLPASFCDDLKAQGTCETCLGTSCCDEITACTEDVGCSQLEGACSGNAACSSTLVDSGNPKAKALGSCAAAHCATDCP